jgi:acyl dehydratase
VLTISGVDGLRKREGSVLGVSKWLELDQALVDAFAEVTRDDFWIHIEPERAKADAPFGGTIVHGLFTLSLGPGFSYELYEVTGFQFSVNYGFERIRFPAPVPTGSRVRMKAELSAVEVREGGAKTRITQTFECSGSEKPVCVAEAIVSYFLDAP